jgi:hypothetical protein
METPTPAQAAAGTTGINDSPSLFLVETYRGHGDVSPGVRIALIKIVPPTTLEENCNGWMTSVPFAKS